MISVTIYGVRGLGMELVPRGHVIAHDDGTVSVDEGAKQLLDYVQIVEPRPEGGATRLSPSDGERYVRALPFNFQGQATIAKLDTPGDDQALEGSVTQVRKRL